MRDHCNVCVVQGFVLFFLTRCSDQFMPCKVGAKRLIRSFVSAIGGLDPIRVMDGSDLYSLRFNPNRSFRDKQRNQPLYTTLQRCCSQSRDPRRAQSKSLVHNFGFFVRTHKSTPFISDVSRLFVTLYSCLVTDFMTKPSLMCGGKKSLKIT